MNAPSCAQWSAWDNTGCFTHWCISSEHLLPSWRPGLPVQVCSSASILLCCPKLTTFSSTRMQPGQIPSWMELTFPPDLLGSFLSIAYSQTAG